MKLSFRYKTLITILLIFISQLFISYCSKRIYSGVSFPAIENRAESKRLNTFFDAGIEKELNTRNASPEEIIKTARQYLGTPHCMGGTTTKCIDCSGLLVAVFARYGIILPHNSEEQARYGRILTSPDKLKKGDLVFFIRSYKTNRFITHSGIYIGNNEFIHASTSNGVTITSLDDLWWNERFIFGTRIFD